jgi:hypothetical protein
MLIFQFYRFYLSTALGIAAWLFIIHSFWVVLAVIIVTRTVWFLIEKMLRNIRIKKWYKTHVAPFKELTGPYGIRLINKADSDSAVRNSLSEVFTPDFKELKKTTEQLEMMDTLFKSGLRPDGDSYQLHDLKLKYARHRLEKNR